MWSATRSGLFTHGTNPIGDCLCLRAGLDLLEKGIIYFSLLVIEPRFLTLAARSLFTVPSQLSQPIDLLVSSASRNVHGLPVNKP
jgi:hypothetical protein